MRHVPRAVIATFAAALYLPTLQPGAGWLDTSELAAGAHTLGIAHPPGHPLYVMFAKAAALILPFGSIATRIHLVSVFFGILCAVLVGELVRMAAATARPPRRADAWLGALAGALFAATEACWQQSVRAEVYTLHGAVVLGAMVLGLRWWRDRRVGDALAASTLLALGLANHHYLVFFFLPAALTLLLSRPEGRRLLTSRALGWAVLLSLFALLAYAYLPVRASTYPEIDWGHPTTPARIWDTITAATFQASTSQAERGAPITDNLITATTMLWGQVTPLGWLFGLVGLLWLVRRSPGPGWFFVVAFLANLMTKAIMRIDPGNPDDYGYFMLAVAVLCVGCGVLAAFAWEHRPAVGLGLGGALLAGIVAVAAVSGPRVSLRHDHTAEAITDATLDRVPPRSVLLLNYFGLYFAHWHARLIDGRRPDLAVVHATFDAKRYEGRPYVEAMRRRHPDLEPLWAEYLRTLEFPETAVRTLAQTRPVYVEPMLERTPDPSDFEAFGVVRRVSPPKPVADPVRADHELWARVARQADAPLHAEARKALSWLHFLNAAVSLRQGRGDVAAQTVARAAPLSDDPAMTRLGSLARGLEEATGPRTRVQRAFLRQLDYSALLH